MAEWKRKRVTSYEDGFEVEVIKVNDDNKIVVEHTERKVKACDEAEARRKVIEELEDAGI